MEQSDLDLLQTTPSYHLQALLKARHLLASSKAPQPATMPTMVEEVARQLFDVEAVRAAMQGMNASERMIMRELAACGGRANSRDLAFYFQSSGALNGNKEQETAARTQTASEPLTMSAGYPVYPTPHPHGPFELALHHLLQLGLLFWGKQTGFAGRDYTNGVYDGVLCMPQAVLAVARSETPAATDEDGSLATPHALDAGAIGLQRVDEDVSAFQRALYMYWSLMNATREGLPLISSGLLSRPALRVALEQLESKDVAERARAENEAPRLFFMRLLLQRLGLFVVKNGVVYSVRAAAEAFFALPLLERARRCYWLWRETPYWNELAYLPEVILRPTPSPIEPAHAEMVAARGMVVERLLQEQVSVWQAFATFIARAKLYAPYLLFPRQYGPRAERYSVGGNPYACDFRLRRGWLTHREGWHMVEGGFIRAVIDGPLHWFGLVEVDSTDKASAFRVTPSLFLVSSATVTYAPPEQYGRLIVQPNFEMVALAPLSEVLLMKLDRFAERLSLEHIAQYRLTKASVTRAIQLGMDVETMQRVLAEAAGEGVELPQNVRYSLLEWERQARRIEMWQGVTLLEVESAALLDAFYAAEGTRGLFGRRLAPLLAEVAAQHVAAVQELLWEHDYLPSQTSAPLHDDLLASGQLVTREPQWRLLLDGSLQPLYPVTDLFLAAELERISEADEATGWRRITPASIQRALAAGLSLQAAQRFLQHYCQDGMPGSFSIRLKLWGNGYGERQTMRIEQEPLLYLPNEVLQDLRADEEIGALLGGEVPRQGQLAHVARSDLDRLLALLRDRGFVLDGG